MTSPRHTKTGSLLFFVLSNLVPREESGYDKTEQETHTWTHCPQPPSMLLSLLLCITFEPHILPTTLGFVRPISILGFLPLYHLRSFKPAHAPWKQTSKFQIFLSAAHNTIQNILDQPPSLLSSPQLISPSQHPHLLHSKGG